MLGSRKHTRFGYHPHTLSSEERTVILDCFLRQTRGHACTATQHSGLLLYTVTSHVNSE